MTTTRRGSTRAQTRENTERLILESARRHLASNGPAGLSLRAIARDLGMVSSAVYRYVPSRDYLLTELLVEAYNDLADAAGAALDHSSSSDVSSRLRTVAAAMRTWAIGDPARWALLYGSPVPGFHAPAERTVGPGTRVIELIILEFSSATVFFDSHVPKSLHTDFGTIRSEFGSDVDDATLLAATTWWANLVGAISLEVFGQYGTDTFTDPAVLFDTQISTLTALMLG